MRLKAGHAPYELARDVGEGAVGEGVSVPSVEFC
jgi:hypothetical protein